MVRVDERKNPNYQNLSFEELIYLMSWLNLTADLADEVYFSMPDSKRIIKNENTNRQP